MYARGGRLQLRHDAQHLLGNGEHVRSSSRTTSTPTRSHPTSRPPRWLPTTLTLLKSDRVVNETASSLGLESLTGYKTAITSSTTSRVLSLEVTGPDAQMAANIANKMADEVSTVAHDVMNVDSVNIIDSAKVPTAPSGPKRPLYMAVGLLGGLFVAVAIVVVEDMLNTKVRDQEELEELLGVPDIGRSPAMKGGR